MVDILTTKLQRVKGYADDNMLKLVADQVSSTANFICYMVFWQRRNVKYIFSLYLNFSISLTLVYVKITYSVVSVNGIE